MGVEMNVKTTEVLSVCFSEDGGLQGDMKKKVEDGVKTFGARKKKCIVSSYPVQICMWRGIFLSVVVQTVTYGEETRVLRVKKQHKLSVYGVYAKRPR